MEGHEEELSHHDPCYSLSTLLEELNLLFATTFVYSMLVIHPTSRCDICLDDYTVIDAANSPHTISCGHIFCLKCVFFWTTHLALYLRRFSDVCAHCTQAPVLFAGKHSSHTESEGCMSPKRQTNQTELVCPLSHIRPFCCSELQWFQKRTHPMRMFWRC